jgi:hypothetical protein
MSQHKGSPLLYSGIKEFVDRCLIQDRSLIPGTTKADIVAAVAWRAEVDP